MAQSIIGIDIGSYSIKIAKINIKANYFEMLEKTTIIYDKEPFESLKEYFEKEGSQNSFVVSGVKSDEVYKKIIELPFIEKAKIIKILPFQIDSKLPFKIDECFYDYYIKTDKKSKKSKIYNYILKKDVFENWWHSFKKLNINLRSMLPDSVSYRNLFNLEDKNQKIIIDFGHTTTRLTVFNKEDILIDKLIFVGGTDIDSEIAETFGIDIEQARNAKEKVSYIFTTEENKNEQIKIIEKIIKRHIDIILNLAEVELKRLIDFDYENCEILLCGGTAKITNLRTYIYDKFNMKTIYLNDVNESPYSKAIGYALKETYFAKDFKINYLKGVYSTKSSSTNVFEKILIKSFIYAMILIVTFFVYEFFVYKGLKEQEKNIIKNTETLSEKIISETISNPEELLSLITDSDITPESNLIPTVSAFDHLDVISKLLLESNKKIDVKEFDVSEKQIVLKAQVDKIEDIDDVVNILKKNECFKDIQKGKTQKVNKSEQIGVQLTINSMDCK